MHCQLGSADSMEDRGCRILHHIQVIGNTFNKYFLNSFIKQKNFVLNVGGKKDHRVGSPNLRIFLLKLLVL